MKKFGKTFEKVKLRDYAKLKADIGKDSLDLAVKKLSNIKNVEIEYFNQCKKNGVAIALFERLLDQVKTGACEKLSDDLISILRFWIDAVRKKVTRELDHWWDFLKRILKFIQDISCKDSSIPDKLLQLSASLLDLTCGDILSPQQCLNVLQCINMYSSLSGRMARQDNKASIADYFPKLARQILASGHYYYQFSALECIVRWIVPREPAALRAAAATFPRLTNTQRSIFVEAKWGNFVENARDFLNAINKGSGLVKSVMCKKISAGVIEICDSTDKQYWLDISTCDGSVSAVLEPRALQRLVGLDTYACEALVLTPTAVTLRTGAVEVIISLKTSQPPQILPYGGTVGTACDVTVLVSSRENLQTLHEALQNIFGDKYQRLIADDVNLTPLYSPAPSPCLSRRSPYSSDSARFSTAHAIKPVIDSSIKRCGEFRVSVNTSRQSSVSSTSLAQLRIKLAHLPESVFGKEFIRLKEKVKTSLSHISERTEDSFHPLLDHRKAVSDTEGYASVLASKKATITTDNIVDLLIEEAERAKKSCTVVSKTTTDDDQYSTDVISDTPGLTTTRKSLSKKSIQGAKKQNQDTKHIANLQVCNKEMANEDVATDFYESVDLEKEIQDAEDLTNKKAKQKEKETAFDVKNSAKTTIDKAKPKTVRPQRTKKPSYKACEAVVDKFTSNMKQPSKEKNTRVCMIPESEQEDIVEAFSPDNLNQSEVEKPYERDDKPAVDVSIKKRKRKLYSPKDDDQLSKTNKDIIVAQRQKIHHPTEKKAAGNINSNEELLSPRTVKKNVQFDKLIATSENEEIFKEVVVGKNTKADVYNYTSEESYDEDFEERRARMTRRNSTSKTKQTTTARKKGVKKPTATRRTKKTIEKQVKNRASRRNSQSTEIIEHGALDDLDDERMRATNNDNALDNSFVITRPNKEQAPLSFSAQIKSQIFGDDNVKAKKINKKTINDDQQDKPSLITTMRRTTRAMSARQPSPVPSDESGSPLPGLIVENMTSKGNDISLLELERFGESSSVVYEPFVYDEFIKQVMHEQIDVQPNKCKPESGVNKLVEKKQKISEAKSKPATKSGLSKDAKSKRRVEEVEDPQETEDELDMVTEDSDVGGHGNFDEPPPNKQMDKKKQVQKASTTEAKSRVGTNSEWLLKGVKRRIAEVEEPQEIEDEIDVVNVAHGNINEPQHKGGISKPTEEQNINMKDRRACEIMEASGSCDAENESDKSAADKDPAGDVDMASDEGIVNQSNRGLNFYREVLKEVTRRNSATQTSPEKSGRQSTVENTAQTPNTSKNRTSDKTQVKDKNIEARAGTSKHIEQRTNEDTEICFTSRKRKASPERQGGKVPRMLYGEPRRSQDERVSCVRRNVQTDVDNVTAMEGHNNSRRHQLATTSTDARPEQFDIMMRKLERRSKWKLSDVTRILTQLQSEYEEDSGEIMELVRHWKDECVSQMSRRSHTSEENTTSEEREDNSRHQLQKRFESRLKLFDTLQRLMERTNSRVNWHMSAILRSITHLQHAVSENYEDFMELLHACKDDRVSCMCNKSQTRKENLAAGVEEQHYNPRHQLKKNATDILIRQRKRMDERVKWQISNIEQSIEQLNHEISENFADIKEATRPLEC